MQEIMRSFTSCQATDMEWLTWFSLMFTFLILTESLEKAESCISQPDKVIWRKAGHSVVLPCAISSHCSGKDWQYEWFSFKETFHIRIKPHNNSRKYILDGASLHIKSLHANDSGIYYCAAVLHGEPARGTQHIGLGTTLVVKEKAKIMVRSILLWLSFVLLAIYSLAIVTLIVKKYGCKMGFYRTMHKTDRDNSAKKRQFRDVLQEMYSRKNLERSKQSVSRNSSHVEAANTDLNSSNDDIYQNV